MVMNSVLYFLTWRYSSGNVDVFVGSGVSRSMLGSDVWLQEKFEAISK